MNYEFRHTILIRLPFVFCCTLALVASTGVADFPTPTNNDPDGDAPVMSAQEAAESMRLPDGFSASVFAAEPDVQNPIDMAWDAAGRLWVAENYTYSDRTEKFDLGLRDRVVVFEDTDNDGTADSRRVFTDNVQMLTSVEVGLGGVWLMCPPQVLFIPDADHDAVPDGPAEVVLDGFEVASQNYHNFANGLRFGPDGWLYGRCGGSCPGRIGLPGTPDEKRVAIEGGIWRYNVGTKAVEVLTAGTTNPWGHDWNADGELFFINTVNGHLWHGIHGAHFTRPFTLDPNRHTYQLIDFHADHWHFDTTGSWTDSRDGAANDFGGGHAHCGTMIYQGGTWPDKYDGKLFTLNFHGRRANIENLAPKGSGYVGKHEDDFFLSADPWFRGMELSYGPDGNVVVLDWSDTGECHEHTGVHRTSGRIYKISYEATDQKSDLTTSLYQMTDNQLVDLHRHPNEWYCRQARLVLQERQRFGSRTNAGAVESLKRIANNERPYAIRAVSTLHALNQSFETISALFDHDDAVVRARAIALSGDNFPIDDCYGLHPQAVKSLRGELSFREHWVRLQELAMSDPSQAVRLQLASLLQRLPLDERIAIASSLAMHGEDQQDHNLPLMIWYGLMPVANEEVARDRFVKLVPMAQLSTVRVNLVRRMAEDNLNAVGMILSLAAESGNRDTIADTLEGMSQTLRGVRKMKGPESWPQFAEAAKAVGLDDQVRDLDVLFGSGRALDEIKGIALDGTADPATRLSAVETLIQNRPDDLFSICEKLLSDPRTNIVAAKGLSTFDDPKVAELILDKYNRFRAPQRGSILSMMVTRSSFAVELLGRIEKGSIPKGDLTAYQARQIHSLNDESLNTKLSEVWGEIRSTPAAKRKQIDELKASLSTSVAKLDDMPNGRLLFGKHCGTCHQLYGDGGKVGPDLTGANRSNLDYLLENIVDPSAVVDKNFRMTVILLADGRVINGLVLDKNDQNWTVQTATEKLVFAADDIEEAQVTDKSPMPEGILDGLTKNEHRDLIAYLQHPTQVAMPNSTPAEKSTKTP